MTPLKNRDLFLSELTKFSDPQRALAQQKYHKSSRVHLGVSAVDCNRLIKEFSKQLSDQKLMDLAEALWKTNIFEGMISAAKILSLPCIEPSTALWNIMKTFLKDVDGWALEDTLAPVSWKCVLKDRALIKDIALWTTHENFWMRRAALVYTLPFAKQGKHTEEMLSWASLYAKDPEWFIQKAIGWWLRVLGKKNPDRVMLFLEQHWKDLKFVAKKEATRKLPEKLQNKLHQNGFTKRPSV